MLTTSYQAFKVLELLRSRCGLTARDAAAVLMDIDESSYSRLRKSLREGSSALSKEYDTSVCIGLAVLVQSIKKGWLPTEPSLKTANLLKVRAIRAHFENLAEKNSTSDDLSESIEQLLERAKSYTNALLL